MDNFNLRIEIFCKNFGVDVLPDQDFRLALGADGVTQFISFWNEQKIGRPIPSDQELLAVDILPAYKQEKNDTIDDRTRKLMEITFYMDNNGYIPSGDQIKTQVNACKSTDEVDAVKDNR